MIAHVGGLPTEELVLPVAGWAGAGLVLARAWLASRLRRHRRRSVGCIGPRDTSSD